MKVGPSENQHWEVLFVQNSFLDLYLFYLNILGLKMCLKMVFGKERLWHGFESLAVLIVCG